MEINNGSSKKWRFQGNEALVKSSSITVRGVLNMVMENLNPNDTRSTIPLGHGDPSACPLFSTTPDAVKAISDALSSTKFNGYAPTVGVPSARQ